MLVSFSITEMMCSASIYPFTNLLSAFACVRTTNVTRTNEIVFLAIHCFFFRIRAVTNVKLKYA